MSSFNRLPGIVQVILICAIVIAVWESPHWLFHQPSVSHICITTPC